MKLTNTSKKNDISISIEYFDVNVTPLDTHIITPFSHSQYIAFIFDAYTQVVQN